jgi:hypothetical protein
MLRFLVDQFRQAPGPLKQPRILMADIAEEIIDLASHYIKQFKDNTSNTEFTDVQTHEDSKPLTESDKAENSDKNQLNPRLAAAIKAPGNQRKQAFKILAILWDARQKKKGPLSVKAIQKHGQSIGITIRHENIRKVIRMKLDAYVTVHTEGVGSGSVYRHELSDKGKIYFEQTYLNDGD